MPDSKFKGTKTEANLMEAFAGESQARNKYTYFASAAKKEGYEQIAALFEETALNEKEHAKIWFKLLNDLSSTAANLKAAAEGENEEHTSMYPRMAKEAAEEGFNDVAALFNAVGKIEREHEERYLTFLKNIEDGSVFIKDAPVKWKCANCGFTYSGVSSPEKCPVCNHPRAYFEVAANNF